MTVVDPSLWEAFRKAKDALLEALRSSAAETTHPHILSRPPSERRDALRAIHRTIAESNEQLQQLESVKDDLSEMIGYITRGIQRARQLTTPIGILPPELLRDVILYSVNQRSHEETRALASVCSTLRAAVHAERTLYTEANWADWDVELLELWCQRSRGCPLHVRIDLRVASRFDDEEYVLFLQKTVSRWGSLSFQRFHNTHDSTLEPLREFFVLNSLDSLKSLAHQSRLEDPLELVAPNLVTMRCDGRIPIITPSTQPHLERFVLRLLRRGEWSHVRTFLSTCHSLTDLHIGFVTSEDVDRSSSEEIVFTSLRSLRLDHAYKHDITGFLALCSFPNLQEVTLGQMKVELHTTLNFLHPKAPRVRRLQVLQYDEDWSACDLLVSYLDNNLSILPSLHHLEMEVGPVVQARAWPDITCYLENVKCFVARRKIHSLSIPCLTQACIDALQSEFGTIATSTPDLTAESYSSVLRSLMAPIEY